jgi:hypothetical protein
MCVHTSRMQVVFIKVKKVAARNTNERERASERAHAQRQRCMSGIEGHVASILVPHFIPSSTQPTSRSLSRSLSLSPPSLLHLVLLLYLTLLVRLVSSSFAESPVA